MGDIEFTPTTNYWKSKSAKNGGHSWREYCGFDLPIWLVDLLLKIGNDVSINPSTEIVKWINWRYTHHWKTQRLLVDLYRDPLKHCNRIASQDGVYTHTRSIRFNINHPSGSIYLLEFSSLLGIMLSIFVLPAIRRKIARYRLCLCGCLCISHTHSSWLGWNNACENVSMYIFLKVTPDNCLYFRAHSTECAVK